VARAEDQRHVACAARVEHDGGDLVGRGGRLRRVCCGGAGRGVRGVRDAVCGERVHEACDCGGCVVVLHGVFWWWGWCAGGGWRWRGDAKAGVWGAARVMGAASSQSNVTARQDWDARVTLFHLHTALRH
jgi:hypothetical protein